jgi:hypothetical protein
MRKFETGAVRDSDTSKFDYEGFLSPLVLERFARFMHKHRRQKDGIMRDSDNWQKGIPRNVYMKSAWRHFMEWWSQHRGWKPGCAWELEDAICALIFNANGYLHEHLAIRRNSLRIGPPLHGSDKEKVKNGFK